MTLKKLDFLIESIKTIKKSGTLTQSSTQLCKAMTSDINHNHKVIVEIGAGDGAITKHILSKMSKNARVFSFEINEAHFEKLLEFNDERLIPILDSAENIQLHLESYGYDKADIIISSLPFMVLSTELTFKILEKCHQSINKGSLFIQFHYSNGLKKLYKSTFNKVETEFVLLNAPPAIVFRCER